MSDLSLSKKLAISFGAIIALFILLGSAALWCNRNLGAHINHICEEDIPSLTAISLMQNNIHKVIEAQRALMLPGLSNSARSSFLAGVDAARIEYKKGVAIYEAVGKPDIEARLWREFQTELERAKALNDRFFTLEEEYHRTRSDENHQRMIELTMGDIMTSNDRMFASLDKLAKAVDQGANEAKAIAESDASHNRILAMLGTLGGVLAAFVVALLTSRYLARNTKALAAYTREVGQGNLDAALPVKARDEFGQVASGLKDMVASLKEMIGRCRLKEEEAQQEATNALGASSQAREAMLKAQAKQEEMLEAALRLERVVETMTAATSQLAGQVREVGHGVMTQETRSAETAAAMQQMNASVVEVARSANDASEQAVSAREKALAGQGIVGRAKNAIQEVRSVASQLEDSMNRLGDQAGAIGRIMNVISDIADQTNLLALNAAIEAARAGEAGRGFAVVADEVRKLAEKTMTATKEVGQAVTDIQSGIHDNIDRVNLAAQAVSTATNEADQSEDALKEIVVLVNSTGDQIHSIAASAQQQSAASEQINRAVEEISRIASGISQGMNEAGDAVSGLNDESRELSALVRSFRDSDGAQMLN